MYKDIRKLLVFGLSAAMAAGLTACGGGSDDNAQMSSSTNEEQAPLADSDNAAAKADEGDKAPLSDGHRVIKIGTWYDHYYDSTHTSIDDNPDLIDPEEAQMQFDNLKAIEEKYDVEIEFVKLTYDGVKESINTSVLAGQPDCDIYEVDLQFGIPAALNGFATNLAEVLPADADIVSGQNIFTRVDIGEDNEIYLFRTATASSRLNNTYMLAYNQQLLDEAGLESPNALYERGEWTWDKWGEYMLAMTQDTDGDGVTDIYGFGSIWTSLFDNLMMSNGTGIAMGATETFSSPEVAEVLEFIYDMYNVDCVARPWDVEDWNANMNAYMDGKVAFFIEAAWISDTNKDSELGFDVTWCPWPIGPSGNQDTNTFKNDASGSAWMIPADVEDAEFVYNVFEDFTNWYHDDTSLLGNLTWWKESAVTEENYAVMEYLGSRGGVDVWSSLGLEWDWTQLMNGGMTAAEFQETYKQSVQDALYGFYY